MILYFAYIGMVCSGIAALFVVGFILTTIPHAWKVTKFVWRIHRMRPQYIGRWGVFTCWLEYYREPPTFVSFKNKDGIYCKVFFYDTNK